MENTLLNLVPASYLPEVHLSQYDIGRTITFTLKDGASDYSVPSGASVTVKATKPSGLGFEVACTFNGGTVTLVTTETMTPENGRFPAELSIASGNTVIGTSNFIFNIERSPHPEGTIDGDAESLLPELTLLVERIEAAADSVDEDTQIVTDAKAEVLQAKADTLQAKADTLSARDESVSAKDLAVSSAQTSVEALERAEELIGSVSTKADAIVKTASGEVASFTDGGDEFPMKSLKVNIVPKQSGSGDPSPSNVRPISGTDTVNVKRIGKNFLAYDRDNGSYVSGGLTYTITDGHINVNGTSTSNYPTLIVADPLHLKAGTYTISKTVNGTVPSGAYLYIIVENSGLGYAPSVRGGNSFTFTLTEDRDVRIVLCAETSGKTWNNVGVDFQIERGSTATDYEPYEGETITTNLGQTVYGGTLDIVSGKLSISWGIIDIGILTWEYDSAYNFFYTRSLNDAIVARVNSQIHPILSDRFKITTLNTSAQDSEWSNEPTNTIGYHRTAPITITYTKYIYVKDTSTTDPATFKSSVSGSMLAYELATPIEIQLTPTEVKTLLGNNNIWSDSGSVEVEYRADTTLAYNELVAMILENIGN